MGEIERAHAAIGLSVEKVREAIGRLFVARPTVDHIRERFAAVAGEDSENPHAQQAMSILSRIADGLDEVPGILNTAINSANNLDQDI